MKDLQIKVLDWAKEKGILEHGTINAQILKLKEEFAELQVEIKANKLEKIKDEFGDCLVVLTILNKQTLNRNKLGELFGLMIIQTSEKTNEKTFEDLINECLSMPIDETIFLTLELIFSTLAKDLNIDPKECLQIAYDKISKREGKMIDGSFIKNLK